MSRGKDAAIIEFHNVSKKYGDLLALDNISFQINKGDIFGYIGPNGAGKTTSLKILVGLIKNYSGDVFINHKSIRDKKDDLGMILGYLPQETGFQEWRTVYHTLQTFGRLSGMNKDYLDIRIPEVLQTVGLVEVDNKKIEYLSGGMKQKLRFAQAILNNPEILVLDEPLSGLDPTSRFQVKNIINKFAEKDITILFSSHILTDVQDFANRIGILNRGNLLKIGTSKELQDEFNIGNIIEIEYAKEVPSTELYHDFPFIDFVNIKNNQIQEIHLRRNIDIDNAIYKIMQKLINHRKDLRGFNLLKPSLEEVYLKIIEADNK
ncbi:MAG: putative ABC transporter ATP-binding protein YxlF [Promethearchaeota archaeon]|nr:MAG: putative ABC transporter ATP-binding protein YxlF [Candidatus Lokiarchaeota archaeon]